MREKYVLAIIRLHYLTDVDRAEREEKEKAIGERKRLATEVEQRRKEMKESTLE